MSPSTIHIDVTGKVPIDGSHQVAIWVFPPGRMAESVPVLFCLPGGSYTKAYWHLEVPGRSGYSFAEHLADQGMLVIAIDHIGTGESSRHARAVELTPDVVAGANAAALSDILGRVRDGTLMAGMGPLKPGPIVGVGHSMGAMLAIFQQSLHGSFDAVALLGYGTVGPIVDLVAPEGGVGAPTYESVMRPALAGAFDELSITDRAMPALRHHFYWDDVPPDVIEADDKTVTYVPGVTGVLSIVPFIASDHAGRIGCPVFVGLGERDSTSDHHDEPRAFYSSSDITLFLLPRSGHCHNTAGTRWSLWDRLGRWVRALAPTESA